MEDLAYEAKIATAVETLKPLIPKKPLGTPLFNEFARLIPIFTIETVVLRRNERGILEVYLVRRSLTDTAYSGQWHSAGTAIRSGETFNSALKRLLNREYGTEQIGSAIPVGIVNNPLEKRGHFLSYTYLIRNIMEEIKGRWFPVDQLPENTVDHHRDHIIPLAIEAYEGIEKREPVIFKEIEIH